MYEYFELIKSVSGLEAEQSTPAHPARERIKSIAYSLRDEPKCRMDAAVAYYIAGYYVQAARLIRKSDCGADMHTAQRWLALYLANELNELAKQAQEIINGESYSDQTIAQRVKTDGLSDQEAVDLVLTRTLANVIDQTVSFLRTGTGTSLSQISQQLTRCSDLACKTGAAQWWWWIKCFRHVLKELEVSCLWSQLAEMKNELGAADLVSQYIKSNYNSNRPVTTLWRTQIESLSEINRPDRQSLCLAMPTSAGKTRVAELAILRFLLDFPNDPDAKCVYIAPFRKLASDVEQSLSESFAETSQGQATVSRFYGGHDLDILEQREFSTARVLIVTPEKLDGMLRQYPHLLSQIRLLIADEGHMIGEFDKQNNNN